MLGVNSGLIAMCKGCRATFEATGSKAILVLTGGLDCPNCGEKDGICIVEVLRK